MSTPTQTGAQAPSTPAPKTPTMKTRLTVGILGAIVLLAIIVTVTLLPSGGSTPTAAVMPSSSMAPVSTTSTAPAVVAPVTKVPVTQAPVTSSQNLTNSTGILAEPTNKDDYESWVRHLESVYGMAMNTGDPSNLASQYFILGGAAYTAEYGPNSGVAQDAYNVALYRATGNIPAVAITNVAIKYSDSAKGMFIADFTSTYGSNGKPSKYENTYYYQSNGWKVAFQKQFN